MRCDRFSGLFQSGGHGFSWLFALCFSLALWGCGVPITVPPLEPQEVAAMEAAGNFPHKGYRLEPGDKINIVYTFHREMNQAEEIRPDGNEKTAGEGVTRDSETQVRGGATPTRDRQGVLGGVARSRCTSTLRVRQCCRGHCPPNSTTPRSRAGCSTGHEVPGGARATPNGPRFTLYSSVPG